MEGVRKGKVQQARKLIEKGVYDLLIKQGAVQKLILQRIKRQAEECQKNSKGV